MTDKALQMIRELEFSNNPSLLLHKNPTESGLTYYGIYETAHPRWEGWVLVKKYLKIEPNLKKCSILLSNVRELNDMVKKFYKREFWDKMRLDEVKSPLKQLELLCFAINVGIKPAVKVAQKLVGTVDDGIIGVKTLSALNSYPEDKFDILFDTAEIEYYDKLIERNQRLAIYRNGWHNRAKYI